ncbi:unnamed protein product [Danaus chrysippus]|uniref:(African queen) hypothetical protein n=1 Tax=Danaus chrysippus TaxID=151541 RepID=A0A8J2QVH0_9NEOP|nr:unnamed protein product [Danaus chrysippus]
MDDVNDNTNILSCASDIEEDSVMNSDICEQLVEKEVHATSMGECRSVEKRQRQDSDDRENGDEEFMMVEKRSKRIHRSTSGNDETYEVCISSKQALPKQIGMAKLMRSQCIKNILRIKFKGPYKALITFSTKCDAEQLINCQKLAELEYRCQFTNEVQITYGVVKDIDLETEEKEILDKFYCDSQIVSMRRLRRLNNGNEWVPSTTIRLGFKSSTLPPYIFGYGCRFKVEPYTFPVSQCSGCWKFGHLTRSCPTKKIKCPKCGQDHQNCEIKDFVCLNCKGPHMALDKKCPMFIKEKKIREIMSQKNFTYKKALEFYCQYTSKERERQRTQRGDDDFNNSVMINTNEISENRTYRDVVTATFPIQMIENQPQNITHNDDSEDSESRSMNTRYSRQSKYAKKKSKKTEQLVNQNVNSNVTNPPAQNLTYPKEIDSNQDKNTDNLSRVKKLFIKLKEIILSKKDTKDKILNAIYLVTEEICISFPAFAKVGEVIKNMLYLFNG